MKCINCKSELEEGAKFCSACGLAVQQQNVVVVTQPQKKHTGLLITGIVLGALFGMLLVGLILFFALANIGIRSETEYTPEEIYPIVNEKETTIEDPNGKSITLKIRDEEITVDLSYQYSENRELRKNKNILSKKEIESLDTTSEVKTALKEVYETFEYDEMSKAELIDYLKENNYSSETIDYVLNIVDMDWNLEALISAKGVLGLGGFTEERLRSYLEYHQYTESEINAAIEGAAPNYYEQALAEAYESYNVYNKEGSRNLNEKVEETLENSGFTKEERDFALEIVFD